MIRHLLTALFLFPLTLTAQDSLAGHWKVDPAQLEQVHKTIGPIIAKAQEKVQGEAEKQKIQQDLTAAFTGQRFAFIKSDDGIWEQEMTSEGAKARFPITFVKTEKADTYEVHRGGKPLFIVTLTDADHITLTGARDRITFPMVRDTGADPSNGPKATTRSAGGGAPPEAPKP